MMVKKQSQVRGPNNSNFDGDDNSNGISFLCVVDYYYGPTKHYAELNLRFMMHHMYVVDDETTR